MIASIAAEGQATKPAPFGHALVELARNRPEIVGLTADLAKYTDLHIFAQAFPDRFYQMGMAEQLLIGAAAGMAHEGFMPFATTYAVFASRRAYDFICQAIAEENLNVKIVCALPGLTTGYGPSHQATEDLAIFRGMPNLTIIDPCDALDIEQAVPAIAAHKGPVYMRLLRGKVPLVLDEYGYRFELGKAKMLRDGARRAGHLLRLHDHARAGGGQGACEATASTSPCCTCRRSSRWRRRRSCARPASPAGWWSSPRTTPSSAGWARRLPGCCCAPASSRSSGRSRLPDEFLDAGALPTLHDRYGISTAEVARQHQGLAALSAHRHSSSWIEETSLCGITAENDDCCPMPASESQRELQSSSLPMNGPTRINKEEAMIQPKSIAITRRKLLWPAPPCRCAPSSLAPPRRRSSTTSSPPGRTRPIRSISVPRRRGPHPRGDRRALDIKLFPANQLGSDTDLLSQVRNGSVEFFNLSSLILATFVPAAGITNRLRLPRLRRGVEGDGRRPRRLHPRPDRQDADHDGVASSGTTASARSPRRRARSGRRRTSRASRSASRRRRC